MAFELEIPALPFAEFDLGGVLYHANYFRLYEQAREAFLRSIGLPYPFLVQRKSHLVIAETYQSFHAPILYGEPLTVELSAEALRKVSVKLHYRVFKRVLSDSDASSMRAKTLVHEGWSKSVFVEFEGTNFRPSAFPEDLRAGLTSILRAS